MVKRNQGNKLEPLNATIENNAVLNTDERKLSHRLNPLPSKHVTVIGQKKVRSSKIPVLQKKPFYPKQKKDDAYNDTSLSAADRRQKFQQSRLNVVGGNPSIDPLLKKQTLTQFCCDIFPWYEGYILHKVVPQPPPYAAAATVLNQKSILPPIKPVDTSVGSLPKINQIKNKSFLGEFTHFPALCNPVYSKGKKQYISTVPHLPPIISLPPAPPPSISNSLEKDRNHVDKKALGNKWNSSRPVLQNPIPVLF